MNRISLDEKFALFSDYWRPRTVAALNGQEIKLVKVRGEFPWHHHEHEDEFFMVWRGRFRVEFRDHIVTLQAGECVVVPRGTEHRTCADEEASILCFEPAGTVNTGDVRDSEFTALAETLPSFLIDHLARHAAVDDEIRAGDEAGTLAVQ